MLYTAFILGLFGSLHCVAMCGPLVLAFGQLTPYVAYRFVQQFFRIIGYGLIGLILGFLGEKAQLFLVGQQFSLFVGSIILLFTLFSIFSRSFKNFINKFNLLSHQNKVLSKLTHPLPKFAFLGIMNSLLPCGFLYLAFAGALAQGNSFSASIFLITFGLGTFPSMLLVIFSAQKLHQALYRSQKFIIPTLGIFMSSLLIVRGLGIGIPYFSPKFQQENVSCCHKK